MEKNPVTAIIMAAMLEAKPFVEGLSLKQISKKPFVIFQNDNILLVISGIGPANAAKATTYCLERYKPDRICNLGAAGATDFSHPLGEIFQITKIYQFDGSSIKSDKSNIHKPYILGGFKTAQLATSDKAILDSEQRLKISKNAGLVDMEGASVAQACMMFKTKCIMFKFVSDTPDHTSDEDIVKNIRLYRKPFYEFFNSAVLPMLYEKED